MAPGCSGCAPGDVGVVTPSEGVAGFGNPATVTVGAMFIISAGLFKTGAVNLVGAALARIGRRSFWLALLAPVAVAPLIWPL